MIVRFGTVTNIYPEEGKVRVLYEDRDETSVKLPLFAHEYKMPEVGKTVVTLHMMDGRRSSGFVLGEFWSDIKKPEQFGEKLFRKDIGEDSYIQWNDGRLEIVSPEIVFRTRTGTVTTERMPEKQEG